MSKIVKTGGCNLHNHTKYSDGSKGLEEFILYAKEKGLRAVAITDHNLYNPEITKMKEKYESEDFMIINGVEFGVSHRLQSGKDIELHVVVLLFEENSPEIIGLISHYRGQREKFVREVLRRLAEKGMEIEYFELEEAFPETQSLGVVHIAAMMKQKGFVDSVEEGLDLYVGSQGERQCYVKKTEFIEHVTLAECIKAVKAARGFPILAHPYYYKDLSDVELKELIEDFKKLTGRQCGGIEVYYRDYTKEMEDNILAMAGEELLPSCGSDFHGFYEDDDLVNYDYEILEKIIQQHNKMYRNVSQYCMNRVHIEFFKKYFDSKRKKIQEEERKPAIVINFPGMKK